MSGGPQSPMIGRAVGEYRIVDMIGAGGMGTVYRAVHSKIGRTVAVKVLSPSGHTREFVNRFLNEASIQAALHHQHIATLYDFLELDGSPCIIMEHVDGQTLDQRISAFGMLPLSEAVFIFQAIVEACAYIHSHGIIHRDIKSNNVKISSKGEVKLLDFGIAKAESTPKFTVTGDVVGTIHYLAPELVKSGTADVRSDVWALGVLFYEMVTGRSPFDAQTIGALYEKIQKAVYTAAMAYNPSVPPEAEAIIAKCLKKAPSDRYQSAEALLRDVTALASVVSSPRLSSVDHLKSGNQKRGKALAWATSNWAVLAVAAAVVAVLAVVLYLTLAPISGVSDLSDSTKTGPSQTDSARNAGRKDPDTSAVIDVQIRVTAGQAEVYIAGRSVGSTPLTYPARVGDKLDIVLKQPGYKDKALPIEVGPNFGAKPFTVSMDPLE